MIAPHLSVNCLPVTSILLLVNVLLLATQFVFATPSSSSTEPQRNFLFDNDKFVHEIKTNVELESLLQHLANVNHSSPTPPPPPSHILDEFKLSPNDEMYLVMYYADWCPHCHKTAPTWKNLANIFHCTPGIRFFAFECSMTRDDRVGSDGVTPYEACINQTVEAFPTMTAYWPKRLNFTDKTQQEPAKKVSDFSIVDRVVTALSDLSKKEQKIDELNYQIGDANKVVGQNEVLLRTKLQIKSRSVSDFRGWILSHSPISEVKKCTLSTNTDLLAVANSPIDSMLISRSKNGVLSSPERWTPQVFSACPDTRLYDSLNGFLYLLRNWVITETKHGLTQQKNQDLKQLVSSLIPLLPGHNIQLSLKNFYDSLNSQSDFTTSEYHSIIDHIDLGGLKALPIGKNPALLHAPRLTSSVWLLFHTLTVSLFVQSHTQEAQVALLNFNRSCSGPVQSQGSLSDYLSRHQLNSQLHEAHQVTAWGVAKAIRTTVGSFFACEVCRVHFTTFFDLCYADLCHWVKDTTEPFDDPLTIQSHNHKIHDASEGLLLWLWRFHNAVTFRTAVERTSNSIVTLQELAMNKDNQQELLKHHYLVSYEGQDVRFPPMKLCPSCHDSLPILSKTENTTIYELSHHRNITSDAFKVSRSIVEKSVKMERMMRGYEPSGTDVNASSFQPLDDATWDRIEDFDLEAIKQFLIGYLWKPEWMEFSMDLLWNEETKTFIAISETDNQENGQRGHHLQGGHEESNSRKLFGGAAQGIAAKIGGRSPRQQIDLVDHHSIGTAGGVFWFFALSTVLVFVAYAKVKRGTNSLSHEFYRTIGLRHHLKRDNSPRDAELGEDDGFSIENHGSCRGDGFHSRQRCSVR